jgi:hypothetical protein
MLNRDAVGAEGAPFELVIERGKVREFARAVHAPDAAYLSGESPVIPPTFLTTTFFWQQDVEGANPWERVGMSQERGMHAEQQYVFFGPPPRAGTRLTCKSRIERIYDKTGKRGGQLTFAVMVTEFYDEQGKLVAEARLTGVETEKPPEPK